MNINWDRMAVPQADGYDTELILQLAQNRRTNASIVTFCNGKVAVCLAPERGMLSDAFQPALIDHPNILAAGDLLSRWPNAYAQFTRLATTLYPYTDPQQARMRDNALGSSSHSHETEFGPIYATVDNSLGLAQALIGELAHQKLHALGISFHSAAQLITNSPSDRFPSPMRKDKPLPMTAVFHDQYAFMHVTALDLAMLDNATDAKERTHILMLLARNVPRMQAGFEVVAKNIQTDHSGQLFVDSFMQWSKSILDRGQTMLDDSGYGTRV